MDTTYSRGERPFTPTNGGSTGNLRKSCDVVVSLAEERSPTALLEADRASYFSKAS